MKCSVVTGEEFSRHNLPSHLENQRRLHAVLSGVPATIRRFRPRRASEEEAGRIHDREYLAWIERSCREIRTFRMIDPDTYLTHHSYEVALYAAGAAIAAAERCGDGEHCAALVRPPGHHAERSFAMGFCILNNVAIAAAASLKKVDRVAIVDWDLHHGNGTQHAFYLSDRVLYCSVHDRAAFPGTGHWSETGEGAGEGYTINAPLEGGSSLSDYELVFSEVFSPALLRFQPDLCLVSAGQDALYDDPLSSMNLVPEDYALLTAILLDAVEGPLGLILEGGYGPSHGRAIGEIFRVLQGHQPSVGEGCARESTYQTVDSLKRHLHLF